MLKYFAICLILVSKTSATYNDQLHRLFHGNGDNIFQEFYVSRRQIRSTNPDIGLNVVELIQRNGYPVEQHVDIQTEDGYLLDIHRIPHGRKNAAKKGPVLLLPGLFCGSHDWVNMGPEKSLGFLLADEGYDVWLGNNRGTTWSRKHISLDPDDKNNPFYWDFSFHEMGLYDVPAMIDHILNITNESSLQIVGHSQGNVVVFVMLSEKPEYNSKVRLVSALAPAVYVQNCESIVFKLMVEYIDYVKAFAYYAQIYEIMPKSEVRGKFGEIFCHDDSPFQDLCADVFYTIVGKNEAQFNKSMIPVITYNTPAGASLKQIVHFAQEYVTGKFAPFDRDNVLENIDRYGSATPPEYNMKNIKAPLAVYYSQGDLQISHKDVERLYNEVKENVVMFHKMEDAKWTHLDFLWGNDVASMLYNIVIKTMAQY